MKTTGKSASAGQEKEVRLTKEEEFDELLKKRIGEAFRSKSEREKLDLEVLREWAAEDRRKKALREMGCSCCGRGSDCRDDNRRGPAEGQGRILRRGRKQ